MVPQQERKGPRCARTAQASFFPFCCCPLDHTCPLHRLNRPADGRAPDALGRRFAYFLPQSIRCLPFGLPRLRRAQLRDAPPAGKKHGGGEGGRYFRRPSRPSETEHHLEHKNHDPHGHDRHRRSGHRPGPSLRRPGRRRVRLDGHPRGHRIVGPAELGQRRLGRRSLAPHHLRRRPHPRLGSCSATAPASKAIPPPTGSGPRTPASKRSPPRCSSTGPPDSPTDPRPSLPPPPNCRARTGSPTPAGRTRNTPGCPGRHRQGHRDTRQHPLTTSLRFLLVLTGGSVAVVGSWLPGGDRYGFVAVAGRLTS